MSETKSEAPETFVISDETPPKPEGKTTTLGEGVRSALFGERPVATKPDAKVTPRARARKPRTTTSSSKATPGAFVEPLTQLYAMLGVGLSPVSPKTAATIVAQAVPCAEAWDKAAQENEAIRKALESLTKTSVYGALIMAHAPIAISALREHTDALGKREDDKEGDE